ncbi:MAG: hypothetical protein M0Z44_03025 [Gammaproteobacteria bacterium]|nr:hypothetical protein [Gammaproteobacteria bacterium]
MSRAGRVILYVAGLQGPAPTATVWPRTLVRALRHARHEADTHQGLVRLLVLCGWPADTGLAALGRIGEGAIADARWWIRCDPVHLAVHGDRLLMADSETLGLSASEGRRLADTVAPLFVDEGGILEPLAPHRWYVSLVNPPAFAGAPLSQVAGRDVRPYLPGGDSRYWHARLNEAQMLLHQALVGAHGGEAPGVAANSVWFWGAGTLPAAIPRAALRHVYTTDVVVAGLGRHGGAHVHWGLPEVRDLVLGEDLVVTFDGGEGAARYGDVAAWEEFLGGWQETWLEPLKRALAGGRFRELVVLGEEGVRYHLQRRDVRLWRLWR